MAGRLQQQQGQQQDQVVNDMLGSEGSTSSLGQMRMQLTPVK